MGRYMSWCGRCSKPIDTGKNLCKDCAKIMKFRKMSIKKRLNKEEKNVCTPA